MSKTAKNFDILDISVNILYNYFTVQQDYFSDVYPAKILDL